VARFAAQLSTLIVLFEVFSPTALPASKLSASNTFDGSYILVTLETLHGRSHCCEVLSPKQPSFSGSLILAGNHLEKKIFSPGYVPDASTWFATVRPTKVPGRFILKYLSGDVNQSAAKGAVHQFIFLENGDLEIINPLEPHKAFREVWRQKSLPPVKAAVEDRLPKPTGF
jgi:hypothetical protein